jgi:hypothetical protein
VLYAGTYADGLFKSADGGATWKQSSAGMDPNEPIFALVVDPVHTHVVYAGSLRSGVFVSQDGGGAWRPLTQGLRNRTIRGLALAADGQTLYAATHGGGVYRLSTLSQTQFDALAPAPAPAPTEAALNTPRPATAVPATAGRPTEPGATSMPTSSQPSKGGGGLCGGAAALPLVLVGLAILVRSRRPHHPGPTGR